jgi:hypothetical protein
MNLTPVAQQIRRDLLGRWIDFKLNRIQHLVMIQATEHP